MTDQLETVYKLTDENDQTYGGMQWGKGVTHNARGGLGLCSDAWIHAYPGTEIALLMNPVHAAFQNPHLWECKAVVGRRESDKIGCTKLTTERRIRKPRITQTQRRAFGILCALKVYSLWSKHDRDGVWRKWADAWLSGDDRRPSRAASAASATMAARAARCSRASMAAREASAAARAAGAAARAARAVAMEAEMAAREAAMAARAWKLDLNAIAKRAVEEF